MGNFLTTCFGRKSSQLNNHSLQEPVNSISTFYKTCRNGDIDRVQQLLPSMSINEINRIEPNGSTALHAACYHGHYEIVKLLLDAGASRSIRNKHNLTSYNESNEQIKQLFHRINSTNEDIDRFAGISANQEWIMVTEQAAEWKINLYNWLKIEQSFDETIDFLLKNYLPEHVIPQCQSDRKKKSIEWFFQQALAEHDVKYVIKAYTSATPFYTILNNHLRKFLLRFFRQDFNERHPNTVEKSVGYLASIIIYHPDLRSLSFTGLAYRGLILNQQDLANYTAGKRLLNKSFLSSSTDRQIAETFAGAGNSQAMRRNLNHDLIQYITICTYKITSNNTALNIGLISEMQAEKEILIMPLCAFQVKSVKQQLGDDSKIHVEIELVECDSNTIDDPDPSLTTNQRFRVV